ncbi:PIG-P-domain-containing protein [Scheffersomyces xylosifermentans]|uniref:PIG-P-domain-containing protein n=1 Tax=Scheffersomyces xylosifermentans TaxID=1304137 RepID=UPI00315C84D7
MSSLHLNIFPSFSPSKSASPTRGSGAQQASEEDTLARESDVTVSTNVTSYAEYKGFFVYVLSAITLGCYIAWAVLPESFLNDYLSIYYYPDKYWSLAIPSYFLMLMLFTYLGIALYNTEVLTLPLDDIRNFVDDYSTSPGSDSQTEEERIASSMEYIHKAPSGVWDLPITLVNEVLYTDYNEDSSGREIE